MPDEARCTVNVTIHPWCSDPSRDAAVRAAEDGRTGPLPTLEECIERQKQAQTARPCGGTDTAPLGGEPSGAVNGMRTERVTLEIKHGEPCSVQEWSWVTMVRLQTGESVRVVEETHFDDLAHLAMERDAAIRERDDAIERARRWEGRCIVLERDLDAASGCGEPQCVSSGSCGATTGDSGQDWHLASSSREPVAWLCEWTDHNLLHQSQAEAERVAAGDVVPQPLYRSPPQPRGWLSEEEREAVTLLSADRGQFAPQTPHEARRNAAIDVCRNILARSTPPEVVLPERCPRGGIGETWERARDGMWLAALAAAGVDAKEVGRE